ncbi:MAG TPA: DUF1707 domain-containing protein [Acidimicrobiales bacterium]|nr:DUF1707 domain-containing protein [Acidimicrobiales bacterium]
MSHRAEAPRDGFTSHRRGFDPTLRVGDAERNEVIDALSQHFSAGRLDQAELDDRLGRASSAKTGADLSGILTDLPPLVSTAAPAPARRWRTAMWVAVALVLVVLAVPWRLGPWGWWFPHPPLLLVGLVLLAVWMRGRRHRWHSMHGA